VEVVRSLCENSSPIDRIYRSQVESFVDARVCKKGLDSVLNIF
jgi:hypothetical protein